MRHNKAIYLEKIGMNKNRGEISEEIKQKREANLVADNMIA